MTKLRQQLIEVLTLRRYAPKTHEAYVESVAGLARFHHRSPDLLSDEEIKSYLLDLHAKGYAPHAAAGRPCLSLPGLRTGTFCPALLPQSALPAMPEGPGR